MGNILPLQVEYRTLVSIQISPLTLPIKKLLSSIHMEHSLSWYYSCCFTTTHDLESMRRGIVY